MKLECVMCKKRCEQRYVPANWKGIKKVEVWVATFWRTHLGWCSECTKKYRIEDDK